MFSLRVVIPRGRAVWDTHALAPTLMSIVRSRQEDTFQLSAGYSAGFANDGAALWVCAGVQRKADKMHVPAVTFE